MKPELVRVAELARTHPFQPMLPTPAQVLEAAEIREAAEAQLALRNPYAEVLAEIIWPHERPARVPSIGRRT